MKKLLYLLLAFTLAFSLITCDAGKNDNEYEKQIEELEDKIKELEKAIDGENNESEEAEETEEIEEDCDEDNTYEVGIVQFVQHDALDQATEGFTDALTEKLGDSVKFDYQNASGDASACSIIANSFVEKDYDLIMANATLAVGAAAVATDTIPIVGTAVTDYSQYFGGYIPANVTGTSDAVPFEEQVKMMIDTLGLVEGDAVGVIYCTGESNSIIQYEEAKALFEEKGIAVKAYAFSETIEIQALTTTAAEECNAIYIPSDNTVAANDTIVGTICKEKKVPVYTSYGGAISYASLAIDYYELGYETGKMATEILLGTKTVEDLEIKTVNPTVFYNEDICNSLGIEMIEEW